jgi:hypothetical protein
MSTTSSSMKVVAIESSRKEPSIGGDLRELLGIEPGGNIYIQSKATTVSGPCNKVNLSTARLAEFAVMKRAAAGFVFLPLETLNQLGVKTGETVFASKCMPSNVPAIADAASDEDIPPTKAGKITKVVERLDSGMKFAVSDIVAATMSAYNEVVDPERVRSALSNMADSGAVAVSRATTGRGNIYERL